MKMVWVIEIPRLEAVRSGKTDVSAAILREEVKWVSQRIQLSAILHEALDIHIQKMSMKLHF